MNLNPWWSHFDEDPYEQVGRFVPDTFGHPIIVHLSRISWAYLDWLDEHFERDGDWFFSENNKRYDPRECNFDEWMEGAVNGTFITHEKLGNPRPPWCPPAQPWQLVDI
jgi:hypothetical protein